MSRSDITAVAATAQWQERIEKERVHAQARRDFAVNPKTMYVITEKPQQSAWSREFQAQRAAQQQALAAEEEAKGVAQQHYTSHAAHSYSLMSPSKQSPNKALAHTKAHGAAPVRTVVALSSPLTHTTTIVGAGAGAAPASPPPQTPPSAAVQTYAKAMTATGGAAVAAAGAGATGRSPFRGGATLAGAGATIAAAGRTGGAAHMRTSPQRRAHPLAAVDPALASTLRRHEMGPTEKWEWPQTSNHEYGWNTAPVMPPDRATALFYKGLKSSDVSEFVSQYAATQGGKTPFSTQNAANRG